MGMYSEMWKASVDNVASGVVSWQNDELKLRHRIKGAVNILMFSLVAHVMSDSDRLDSYGVDHPDDSKFIGFVDTNKDGNETQGYI
jgi:hypothetical protein